MFWLTHLLRVEVAHLFGHVDHALHLLVVALLGPLGRLAAGAADLLRRRFNRTCASERKDNINFSSKCTTKSEMPFLTDDK